MQISGWKRVPVLEECINVHELVESQRSIPRTLFPGGNMYEWVLVFDDGKRSKFEVVQMR